MDNSCFVLNNRSCRRTVSRVLTHYLEMNVLANVRRGRYLAFVDSRVSDLRVLDLERPVLAGWLVNRPEPLITGVRISAHGQQMDVSVPYPRHLKYTKMS